MLLDKYTEGEREARGLKKDTGSAVRMECVMESMWLDGKGAHGRAEPKGHRNLVAPMTWKSQRNKKFLEYKY